MHMCVFVRISSFISFFFFFFKEKDLPSHIQEMHRRKEFLDHQLDELSRQRALCRGGRELQVSKHFLISVF